MSTSLPFADFDDGEPRRRRPLLRTIAFALWLAILVFQYAVLVRHPGVLNVGVAAAFTLLFLGVNAQMWAQQVSGGRSWRHLVSRLHTSSYISDVVPLPNRNYLLAELRREMARARASGSPFTMLHLELDGFEAVRTRRGDDFANRSLRAFADLLRRITRNSDFLAHLGGPVFAVMLIDCLKPNAMLYLRRVPGTLAVSDGRQMLDMRISARVQQYDLETLYATDVLHAVETDIPLQREQPRDFSTAA